MAENVLDVALRVNLCDTPGALERVNDRLALIAEDLQVAMVCLHVQEQVCLCSALERVDDWLAPVAEHLQGRVSACRLVCAV